MEFIVSNKKYSIINHELYINYLMVDAYFKDNSKYDYNIHFDFLDSVLEKDEIKFEDILEVWMPISGICRAIRARPA